MGASREHRQLGLPAFIVHGGVATAVDLVVSAGIAHGTGSAVVFAVFAVAATVCADWILQRVMRASDKGEA